MHSIILSLGNLLLLLFFIYLFFSLHYARYRVLPERAYWPVKLLNSSRCISLAVPPLLGLLPTRSHYTLLLHHIVVVVELVLFCIWPLVSCSYLQLQRLLLRFHTHTHTWPIVYFSFCCSVLLACLSSHCCTYLCHSQRAVSFYARHVRNSVINLDADMQKRFGFSSISYFACFFSCVCASFCSFRVVSPLGSYCCMLPAFLAFPAFPFVLHNYALSCESSERLFLVALSRSKLCI